MEFIKIVLLIVFLLPKTYAFTFNNSAGASFEQDEVKIYVNSESCDNIGYTVDGLHDLAVEAGANFWNRAPNSRLKIVAGGITNGGTKYKTDLICVADSSPDCNEVNSDLLVANDILIACNQNATTDDDANFGSNSVLAITLPNHISGQTIKGALILINDRSGTAFASKGRDEQIAILAHEIGHAVGLGHSGVNDSLMHYESVSTRNALGWDDIQGITYLYPRSQPFGGCGTISTDSGRFLDGLFSAALGLLLALGLIRLFLVKFKI